MMVTLDVKLENDLDGTESEGEVMDRCDKAVELRMSGCNYATDKDIDYIENQARYNL